MLEGKLCYRGGWLCFEYQSTQFNEPQRVRQYWRIMPADNLIVDSDGCYAYLDTRYGGAIVQYKMGKETHSAWSQEIPVASKCHETIVEDYPCPKVRKGIETRYRNGRWEKYLRSGWAAA